MIKITTFCSTILPLIPEWLGFPMDPNSGCIIFNKGRCPSPKALTKIKIK